MRVLSVVGLHEVGLRSLNISDKYNVEENDVKIINFDAAFAIKVTIPRITCLSGSPGDTDVYGAQQHTPLNDLMIP